MDLYVYSDESGVCDYKHYNYYAFGGVICLGQAGKDEWARRFLNAEQIIKKTKNIKGEAKAARIDPASKRSLFRSLNNCVKFGVIISQQKLLKRIFECKKDKQRYLDFAYRKAVRRALREMIEDGSIDAKAIRHIYFYVDEHTTATNGCYELHEGLEVDLMNGTYSHNYDRFFPPLFPSMKEVNLKFCNSDKVTLVRAADIVANRLYYEANNAPDIKTLLRNINDMKNMYASMTP